VSIETENVNILVMTIHETKTEQLGEDTKQDYLWEDRKERRSLCHERTHCVRTSVDENS